MTIEDFCAAMGFGSAEKHLLEEIWDEAVKTAPADVPAFMTMDFCRNYYPMTGGDLKHLTRMEEVCRIVERTPEAALYAWILHYGFFLRRVQAHFRNLPLPSKVFGENAGIFQLMAAVSAIPLIEKTLERMKIPHSYVLDIAKWIGGTIGLFEIGNNGIPGHTLQQTSWIRNYIDGRLFRIGRFEFLMHEYPLWMPAVYRNRKDGSLMVLCRDGWRFLPDGVGTVRAGVMHRRQRGQHAGSGVHREHAGVRRAVFRPREFRAIRREGDVAGHGRRQRPRGEPGQRCVGLHGIDGNAARLFRVGRRLRHIFRDVEKPLIRRKRQINRVCDIFNAGQRRQGAGLFIHLEHAQTMERFCAVGTYIKNHGENRNRG